MNFLDILIRCLRAGDLESALMVWRSKGWTELDKQRAQRLIKTARDMAIEVL